MGEVMARYKLISAGQIVNIALFDDPRVALEAGYVPARDDDQIVFALPSEKDAARARLAAIDAESGMSRLLRETLRSLAGANAPALLVQFEAEAAAERAKLAAK